MSKIAYLFIAMIAGTALAAGQSSGAGKTTAKPDPVSTVNKPLTPKSAMPGQHKSAAAMPVNSNSQQKTSAEIDRVERENVKAGTPKTAAPKTTNGKSSDATSGNNTRISAKYQKPAGGMTAATPNARTRNSSTPRVNKQN